MIDFNNASFFKLKAVANDQGMNMIGQIMLQGEVVTHSFQSIRDMVIFTNMRIVAVNVQGLTGKKKDFSTLPFSKIQAFSVETAGHFDLDSELELWFSGLGKVKFEFTGSTNISDICRVIGSYVLR